MRKALYREYRPTTFDEVVGQDHITSVLSYQCANKRTSHAYLFCGSRGTGKTSCAKILAKAVNCKDPINGNPCCKCESCLSIDSGSSVLVYEMDAASNTGVDYVRSIKEEITFSPATDGVRVYIIDEVHMLSEGAFNALLKTLEEPPAGVMFILATTETRKVPATILSRCQRFDFRRISNDLIAKRLEYICEKENISIDKGAAELIAKIAQGGMRDSISLLELCAGDKDRIDEKNVRDTAGVFGREVAVRTVEAIGRKDTAAVLDIIYEVYSSSKDLSVFLSDIIGLYRDMTVQKSLSIKNYDDYSRKIFDTTVNEFEEIKRLCEYFTYEKLVYHYKILSQALFDSSKSESKRIIVEMALLRLASDRFDSSPEALSARIADLEKALLRIPEGTVREVISQKAPEKVEKTKENPEKTPKIEKTVNNAESNGNCQVSRTLWNKVLEIFNSAEPSMSPFLVDAVPLSEGDVFVVRVPMAFTETMLVSYKSDAIILNALKSLGKNYSSVKFRVEKASQDDYLPIDELL